MPRGSPDCQEGECSKTLQPATLGGTALVGWYCSACTLLYPAGEGIEVAEGVPGDA